MKSISLFALVLALFATGARAEVKSGQLFPVAALAGLAGGDASEFAGKVLVVDFWASWCAPCKASFPSLGRVATDYAKRGVVLLGVGIDENPAAHAAFVKKLAPAFRTLHDAKHELARTVSVPSMPTTYVIDREGVVRFVHAGFHGESSERRLRADIDALLASTK